MKIHEDGEEKDMSDIWFLLNETINHINTAILLILVTHRYHTSNRVLLTLKSKMLVSK